MPTLVNQAEKVNRLTFDLIIHVERKWLRPAARKSMRPNVVAATPANDLSCLSSDAFVKRTSQSLGDFAIPFFFALQVIAKESAKNRLHSGRPNTSSNVSPESLREIKSLSR